MDTTSLEHRLRLIDWLSNLQNLRNLYLSDNRITDISPLLTLNKREYLEIKGKRVS